MASKNLAPETPPSRGISSRLLTMKFMQRAVASESNQSSPQSASSSTKRRKVDSPLTGEFHSFDEAAIQAAMKQQEAVRQAALSKHKGEHADTPWVLSGFSASARPAKVQGVTYVSYGSIDATDAEDGEKQATKLGRQKIGNFKSKTDEKPQSKPEESDSDDYSSDDSSDDSSGGKETPEGSKARKHSGTPRHSAEASRARAFRDKRKKEVNLNTLTSISGGASTSGGGGFSAAGAFRRGGGDSSNIQCYNCGKKGHIAGRCPSGGRRNDKRKSLD